MATQSTPFPPRDNLPLSAEPIPDWKANILEKKRRAKEIELLLKEEEKLKLKSIPEWKRELIKKTRSSTVKAPVFKTAAPPLPTTPPPTLVEAPGLPPPSSQPDLLPLPPWIRMKLSQVANQIKSDQKPQEREEETRSEEESQPIQPNLPRMVQNIVHKFSHKPPTPPSSSLPLLYLPETPADTNLIDDPALDRLPDWKRSIIVRRKRGQVLKRLSLTKDDLFMDLPSQDTAQSKSTPDSVDIQLQNMSTRVENAAVEVEIRRREPTSPPPTGKRISIESPRSLFITQEPQKKVRDLLDKFAPPLPHPISATAPPSLPTSMKIAKRDFDPIPVPPHLLVKPPPPPIKKEPTLPHVPHVPLPLSPERVLTVEEYTRHHALLVQAVARQQNSPLLDRSEHLFSFIVPENTAMKRPRSRSLDSPVSSVDHVKLVTEIPQPVFPGLLAPAQEDASAEVSDSGLEEVTLSYIDEVTDDSVVPIHRPNSQEQVISVPWKDALDKIKLRRQEKSDGVETFEKEIVIISSHEGLSLKSSLKGAGARSKRRRVYFSEKKPSVFQYPKMEHEDRISGYGMYSYADNQEDLSHRLHPSIFSARQPYQSDKLQNYTPAILDYFDSLVSPPSQNMWVQGEDTETTGPTRDEVDEVVETLTAVPMDAEEELDMSNLSDRAAAMIW